MRSLGLPELLIILTAALILTVLVIVGGIVLWRLVDRRQNVIISSRKCGHCSQQIPTLGSFCPMCGQRTT